jgi:hypothetical protein
MKTLEKISLQDWDLLSEQESAKLYGGTEPPAKSDSTSVATDSTKTSVSKTPITLTLSGSTSHNDVTKTTSVSTGVSVGKSGKWSAGVSGGWSSGLAGSGFNGTITGSYTIPIK